MTTDEQRAKNARRALIRWGYPAEWVNNLPDQEAIRQRQIEWGEADKGAGNDD